MPSTLPGPDGRPRCDWCGNIDEFFPYHDTEWGFPVADDRRLFEKLCLESFQSGLSWRTILSKRENFRRAFKGFDIDAVARFDRHDIERLLQDSGIVRHRGKIEAVINNARCARQLIETQGSLAAWLWQFEPPETPASEAQTQTTTPASMALSRELKKHGWKFVGPTTLHAFMQAMGMINDHVEGCIIRQQVDKARKHFQRPG